MGLCSGPFKKVKIGSATHATQPKNVLLPLLPNVTPFQHHSYTPVSFVMSNITTQLLVFDLFPAISRSLATVSIVPGEHHIFFPNVPIYNTHTVPPSENTIVYIRSHQITSYKRRGYTLPTHSLFHNLQILSTNIHSIIVLPSSASQYQHLSNPNRMSILLRNGRRIQAFDQVWSLKLVQFETTRTDLFYRIETGRIPVLLCIQHAPQQQVGFKGHYQVVYSSQEQESVSANNGTSSTSIHS